MTTQTLYFSILLLLLGFSQMGHSAQLTCLGDEQQTITSLQKLRAVANCAESGDSEKCLEYAKSVTGASLVAAAVVKGHINQGMTMIDSHNSAKLREAKNKLRVELFGRLKGELYKELSPREREVYRLLQSYYAQTRRVNNNGKEIQILLAKLEAAGVKKIPGSTGLVAGNQVSWAVEGLEKERFSALNKLVRREAFGLSTDEFKNAPEIINALAKKSSLPTLNNLGDMVSRVDSPTIGLTQLSQVSSELGQVSASVSNQVVTKAEKSMVARNLLKGSKFVGAQLIRKTPVNLVMPLVDGSQCLLSHSNPSECPNRLSDSGVEAISDILTMKASGCEGLYSAFETIKENCQPTMGWTAKIVEFMNLNETNSQIQELKNYPKLCKVLSNIYQEAFPANQMAKCDGSSKIVVPREGSEFHFDLSESGKVKTLMKVAPQNLNDPLSTYEIRFDKEGRIDTSKTVMDFRSLYRLSLDDDKIQLNNKRIKFDFAAPLLLALEKAPCCSGDGQGLGSACNMRSSSVQSPSSSSDGGKVIKTMK